MRPAPASAASVAAAAIFFFSLSSSALHPRTPRSAVSVAFTPRLRPPAPSNAAVSDSSAFCVRFSAAARRRRAPPMPSPLSPLTTAPSPPLTSTAMASSDEDTNSIPSSSAAPSGQWSPLTSLLDVDPEDLATGGRRGAPRLAKDAEYASAVQSAWGKEVAARSGGSVAVGRPLVYGPDRDGEDDGGDGGGTVLHGYVARPSPPPPSDDGGGASSERLLPGLILFHTGAGPQDAFLHWTADALVNDVDTFGPGGCVVLIADLLSDGDGWAWDADRTRYNAAREEIMRRDDDGGGATARPELRRRVGAAIDAIRAQTGVDPDRIGALGWCLGGHPILEIASMDASGLRAVVTFHGVFDGVAAVAVGGGAKEGEEEVGELDFDGGHRCALICTGSDDPFVTTKQLDACRNAFVAHGWGWDVRSYGGARHGFTNPAQDFNLNEAFGFDVKAAEDSWWVTRELLGKALGRACGEL